VSGTQNLNQLREFIRRHGFCAIGEVINGLQVKGLEEKISQVQDAKAIVQDHVGPHVQIHTGLIFYKNRRLTKQFKAEGIDFIAELPDYEDRRLVEALTHASYQARSWQDKQMATAILQLVRRGYDLDKLFYPDSSQKKWSAFQSEIALAHGLNRIDYLNKIAGLKGLFLEEYSALTCEDAMPDAHVYRSVVLQKKDVKNGSTSQKPQVEIDVLVVGSKESIIPGFKNNHYFIPRLSRKKSYSSSERVPSSS